MGGICFKIIERGGDREWVGAADEYMGFFILFPPFLYMFGILQNKRVSKIVFYQSIAHSHSWSMGEITDG